MISYSFDYQLKKELTDAIKGEKYYHTIRGVVILKGIDTLNQIYATRMISINGEIKRSRASSDDTYKWPCRFEGHVAPAGIDTLVNPPTCVEFPINDNWDAKQIARSIALNLGIIFGLEI